MAIVTASVCALFVVLEIWRRRAWSPAGAFNLMWGLLVLLSSLGLFGAIAPSDRAYGLILLFVVFFNAGAVLFRFLYVDKTEGPRKSRARGAVHASEDGAAVRPRKLRARRAPDARKLDLVLLVMNAAVLMVFLPFAASGLRSILEHGLSYLRNMILLDHDQIAPSSLYVAAIWLGEPVMMAGFLRVAADIRNIRRHLPLLGVCLAEVVCVFFMTAGRSMVMFCMLFLVVGAMIEYKGDFRRLLREQKLLLALGALGVALLLLITRNRSLTASASIFENAYFYFVGSLSLLSAFLDRFTPQYLFFRNLFEAVAEPVIVGFSRVFQFDYTSAHSLVAQATQTAARVSGTVTMNNNCTMVFAAYYDMGIAGVAVYSFLFGVLIAYSARAERDHGEFGRTLRIYAYLLVIFSSFEWLLGRVPYAYLYVVLLLVYKTGLARKRGAGKDPGVNLLKYYTNISYRAEVLVRALSATNNRALWYLLHHKLCIKYGVEIGKGARIGTGMRIGHVGGIVIGDGVTVGDGVTIYQNVTLGQKDGKYPVIEDGVIIYPGSVILGGMRVGRNSVIGANSVVLSDVPENEAVAGVPAKGIGTRQIGV